MNDLTDKVNRTFEHIIQDITTDKGTYNTGILATYITLLFKLAFATIEKEVNIEAARVSFKAAVDYLMDVMIDGAYDREKKQVKNE